MNNVSDIEAELKKLGPEPLRAELIARIEQALREETLARPTSRVVRHNPSRTNWLSLGLGLGLAAAAGFLILARVRDAEEPVRQERSAAVVALPRAEPAGRADARFLPAGLTEVVYNMRDEGLRFPQGETQPVRRLRCD